MSRKSTPRLLSISSLSPILKERKRNSTDEEESFREQDWGPIILEDHIATPTENSSGLWARSCKVVDYIIVGTGAGAYVAWNCVIETFEGVVLSVRKRYSEFFELREQLCLTFPNSEQYLPPLPPKSLISRFRPRFLESRRQGLSYFLSSVILNPEFAGSPIVRNFLLRNQELDTK